MTTLLLSLLLLAGPALAGSPDAPEAVDDAGDARIPLGCMDLLGLWVESTDAGAATFNFQVASCSPPEAVGVGAAVYWAVDFSVAHQRYFVFSFYDASSMSCVFHHGRLANGAPDENHKETSTCTLHDGAPAHVEAPFSTSLLTLAPGDAVELNKVYAGTLSGMSDTYRMDFAEVKRAFVQPGGAGEDAETNATDGEADSDAPDGDGSAEAGDDEGTEDAEADDDADAAVAPAGTSNGASGNAPEAATPGPGAALVALVGLAAARLAGRRRR